MTKELDCLIAKLAQETTIPELLQIISALNFQLQQKQEKEIQKGKGKKLQENRRRMLCCWH